MSEIKYTIKQDIITGDTTIKWSNILHLYKYVYKPNGGLDFPAEYYRITGLPKPKKVKVPKQEWKIDLDFNLKQNTPCLHFRYEGVNLSQKDVVYFVGSGKPFIELTVVQKPHQYKGKMKEVDFYLSEDDINKLKDKRLRKIYIKHANGDSPFEEDVCQSYEQQYDITSIGDPYLFGKFVGLYSEALETGIEKAMGLPLQALRMLYSDTDKLPSKKQCVIKYDYCYVYLMHDKRNGYHKIGISKTPEYREKTLQSEQPNIEMVCSKRYPSRKIAKAFESALHDAYAEQRVRGEWFNLTEMDIEMLKESLS